MKVNSDTALIAQILASMPDARESAKREALRDACPYSVSSLSHRDWTRLVNKALSASIKPKTPTKSVLPDMQAWADEHLE